MLHSVNTYSQPLTSDRGGSLVTDFLSSSSPLFTKEQIYAAVRSEAQAQALSKLGINVLRLDLGDEESVVESLRAYDSTEAAGIESRPTLMADPF